MKMKIYPLLFLLILCSSNGFAQKSNNSDELRLTELDEYWTEVSRTISDGDFEAYSSTFHENAVLVTDIGGKTYPIGDALARWKKDFDDTRAGSRKSSVDFRFRKRIGDSRTAHESGIFHYSFEIDGKVENNYIEFEALLIKENGWKMIMEYQKSETTKEDWDSLKSKKGRNK